MSSDALQSVLARNIAATFKTVPSHAGIQTNDELIKSWSTELRDSNEGSRWVTMGGSHVLLGGKGEILAAHSHLKGKLEGKAAAKFVESQRAGGSEKKETPSESKAAPKAAGGEEEKKPAEKPAEKPQAAAKEEKTATAPEKKEEPKEEPKTAEKPAEEKKELLPHEAADEKFNNAATTQDKIAAYVEDKNAKHDPRDNREGHFAQKAKEILEGDLSDLKKPAKGMHIDKDDIGLDGMEINPQPIATAPAKAKDEVDALKKIVSTDETRASMTGVYFDEKQKQLVATNGHMVVVIPKSTEEMGDKAGKTIDPKTGKTITDRYPDYVNVIPQKPYEKTGDIADVSGLRDQLSGMVKANTQIGSGKYSAPDGTQHIRAEVKHGDNHYYFDPKFMKECIDSLQATGSKNLRLEMPDAPGRAAFIRDSDQPGKFAMLMPIMNKNSKAPNAKWGEGFGQSSDQTLDKTDNMAHTNIASFDAEGKSVGPELKPAEKKAPKPKAEKPAPDPRGDFYAAVPKAPNSKETVHQKVAGEHVPQLDHLGDFAVHRNVDHDGKPLKGWSVTEGRSGLAAGGGSNKEAAITNAVGALQSYDKAKLDNLVNGQIDKTGISPRYASEEAPATPAAETETPAAKDESTFGPTKSLEERRAARAARGSEADAKYKQVADSLTGGAVNRAALKNDAKYSGYEKDLHNSASDTKEQLDKVVKDLEDSGSFHPETNEEGDFKPENLTEQEREIHALASDLSKKLDGKKGAELSAAVLLNAGKLTELSDLGNKPSKKPGAKRWDTASDSATDINYHLQDGLYAAEKMAKMQTKGNAYTSSSEKNSMQDMFGNNAATLPSTKDTAKPAPNARVEAAKPATVGTDAPAAKSGKTVKDHYWHNPYGATETNKGYQKVAGAKDVTIGGENYKIHKVGGDRGWAVSDAETGTHIASGSTQAFAQAQAERKLGSSKDALKQAAKDQVAKYGPMPQTESEKAPRAAPGTAPKKEPKAAAPVDNTPKPYAGAWDGKDIAVNDPKAADKLSDKIDKLQKFQDTMTAANKLVRKNDTEGLKKLGYDEGQIAKLMKNGYDNKPQGHKSWELSNNNATIGAAKKRLEEVNKRSTLSSSSSEKHGVGVEHDIEGNRTRLTFPGKPGPSVRADLKASGFRWAPSEGAWQAYYSESSKYQADRILDKHKDNFEKGDAYEDESGLDTIQKALADSQLILEHSF